MSLLLACNCIKYVLCGGHGVQGKAVTSSESEVHLAVRSLYEKLGVQGTPVASKTQMPKLLHIVVKKGLVD